MRSEPKEPLRASELLRVALKEESDNHAAMPAVRDLPDCMLARYWRYSVLGYSLLEQGLKSLSYFANRKSTLDGLRSHNLFFLFKSLPRGEREMLGLYYSDFRLGFHFPYEERLKHDDLCSFLKHLDRQDGKGSEDWRYALSQSMVGKESDKTTVSPPRVDIYMIHEVVFGCVQLLKLLGRLAESKDFDLKSLTDAQKDEALAETRRMIYSWRLHQMRLEVYRSWMIFRMDSSDWSLEGDRVEILSGPTYEGRYDYWVVRNGSLSRPFFAPLPDEKEIGIPFLDRTDELHSFEPQEGWGSFPEPLCKLEGAPLIF